MQGKIAVIGHSMQYLHAKMNVILQGAGHHSMQTGMVAEHTLQTAVLGNFYQECYTSIKRSKTLPVVDAPIGSNILNCDDGHFYFGLGTQLRGKEQDREVRGRWFESGCTMKFDPALCLVLGLPDIIPLPAEQSVSSGRTHSCTVDFLQPALPWVSLQAHSEGQYHLAGFHLHYGCVRGGLSIL